MAELLHEVARAKINLALHVRARMPDGYHALETLFAFADDGDRLALAPEAPLALTIGGRFGTGLSADEDNLVIRAARGFAARFSVAERGGFTLNKRLPIAAGIGGGSADAAAALRLMARAHGIAPGDPELVALAVTLGADVPACLDGRMTRGEGRGDALVPVAPGALQDMPLLLVNPGVACPTGPVFKAWDGMDRGALADGDPLGAALAGRNDLEPPARRLVPGIAAAIEALSAQPGVLLARMSGSGATAFALFREAAARDAAAAAIGAGHPGWWQMASRIA